MEKKKKYVNERYIKTKDSSIFNNPLLTEKPKSLKDQHFANFLVMSSKQCQKIIIIILLL